MSRNEREARSCQRAPIDQSVLHELQHNAAVSYASWARPSDFPPPRLTGRKLRERGTIRATTVDIETAEGPPRATTTVR